MQRATLAVMSGMYDDAVGLEATSDSFWEVGNYKRTVRRIDDGFRLCNDMMACVHERSKIEKAYAQQLTEWTKKWKVLIDKGPQYGTVERAWHAVMTEADKVSDLHHEVRNILVNEDLEKIKNWQKDSYHKQMIGGFKETKEAEDGFRKAQKPWAKKLKEVEAARKSYHVSCKEEHLASTREHASKADQNLPAETLRKLQDKVDKSHQEALKAKEKYEKSLEDLNKYNPQYMENMEQVFEQCQQFEQRRLSFLKEVLMDIQRNLDLSSNINYANVYRELRQSILAVDDQEDLKWFRNVHGAGMPMNWPQFEPYCPDANLTISRKERSRKGEGITLTGVTPAGESSVHHTPIKSGSGSDQPDWSDDDVRDEVLPGTASNGEQNPFDEDASGVRVRALYDYQGQEQDELSFAAGEELVRLESEDEQGWCKGRLGNGEVGLFPANYVEEI